MQHFNALQARNNFNKLMAAVPEANSRRNVKAKGEAKRESALTQRRPSRRPLAADPLPLDLLSAPPAYACIEITIAPSCYLGSQGYEQAAAVQSCIESR